jgi:cyclopropane fatty-acyl-phospholipid synthase-like methyltransferase
MKDFWNERYRQPIYIYGKSPNGFFVKQLSQIPKGRILLPAEGEGRNAVYAAIKGWQVDAFDYSEEGFKKAQKLSENYQVEINYEVMQASDFEVRHSYDAIALIFAHFARKERGQLFHKLQSALVPGGFLIMEVFSKNQLGRSSGGPKDVDLLYSKEEIKQLFPELDFTILEETKVELDEGDHHQGEAAVIRVLAQKIG